jgi:uncharacterized protein
MKKREPIELGKPRARPWANRLGVGILALGAASALWGFGIEPGLLSVSREELALPRWPAGLSGFRIAVLTDLHIGAPHVDLEALDDIVARTNAAECDLVVILGDLVIDGVKGGTFVPPEPIGARLGRLQARRGVYAVLGNHDFWLDGPRVERALEDNGIVVLDDEAKHLPGEPGLWIAGVSDAMTRAADVKKALAPIQGGDPVLVLTHNPDVFPDIPDRVSLTLAGHTHGGQVYVPLLGRPIVPSRYGERFAAGHIVEGGRHLFVGVGIGTSILPVRFLVRPRIDVLTLRPGLERVLL